MNINMYHTYDLTYPSLSPNTDHYHLFHLSAMNAIIDISIQHFDGMPLGDDAATYGT